MLIRYKFDKEDVVEKGPLLSKDYHFKRNANGHYVSDVTHKSDLARLLSITEGYELYEVDKDGNLVETEEVAPEEQDELASGQPPIVDEFEDDEEEPKQEATPPAPKEPALVEWAKSIGIDDPRDKDALETYAKANYGVDLDKRKGYMKLLAVIKEEATKAADD